MSVNPFNVMQLPQLSFNVVIFRSIYISCHLQQMYHSKKSQMMGQ